MSTTKKIYNFLEEPRGAIYQELLKYGLRICNEFILVVRPTLPLERNGKEILEQLTPFLREELHLQSWPGTTLLKGYARVHFYKLTPQSTAFLLNSANFLFDWCQPRLPEDLCLIRDDKSPWLVSVSHEKDSYLHLSKNELDHLLSTVPLLKELISPQAT